MAPEASPAPGGDGQSLATGLLGTGVLVVGAVACAAVAATGYDSPAFAWRYPILAVAVLAVMAAWELAVVRVYRRNFDFASPRPLDRPARRRVWARVAALAGHLALALAAYVILVHYGLDVGGARLFRFEGSWYESFFPLFFALAALTALLGPVYALLCERYGRWPPEEDDLLSAARGYAAALRLRRPDTAFWAAQRAVLVKFYFLPVMTVFLVGNAANFEGAVRNFLLHGGTSLSDTRFLALCWSVAFHGMYLVDVALAVLGYIVALRLLDTHVRSADPTLSGWLVAVVCYPPFTPVVDLYLSYRDTEASWPGLVDWHPVALVAVGGVALTLIAVYTMATVAFGLRFSNMTNRGILTRGPYGWVRHPAYASKALSWWVLSAPFLRGVGDTVRLALWTAIYVGRALTEERHLDADPDYRAYKEQVRFRFIPGVW